MNLALWILAVYGLTFLLADASVLDRPRALVCRVAWFSRLVQCYFCLGFWVALALHLARTRPTWSQAYVLDAALWVFGGAAGSYLLSKLADVCEAAIYLVVSRGKDE